MTREEIIILITCLIVGGSSVALIGYLYFNARRKRREEKRLKKQESDLLYEKEPEYVFTTAKVVSLRNDAYHKLGLSSLALSSFTEECYATFLTEQGEEKEYPISKEQFYQISEGDEGTLVTVNGNFFYFGEGEDIEEENSASETNE